MPPKPHQQTKEELERALKAERLLLLRRQHDAAIAAENARKLAARPVVPLPNRPAVAERPMDHAQAEEDQENLKLSQMSGGVILHEVARRFVMEVDLFGIAKSSWVAALAVPEGPRRDAAVQALDPAQRQRYDKGASTSFTDADRLLLAQGSFAKFLLSSRGSLVARFRTNHWSILPPSARTITGDVFQVDISLGTHLHAGYLYSPTQVTGPVRRENATKYRSSTFVNACKMAFLGSSSLGATATIVPVLDSFGLEISIEEAAAILTLLRTSILWHFVQTSFSSATYEGHYNDYRNQLAREWNEDWRKQAFHQIHKIIFEQTRGS